MSARYYTYSGVLIPGTKARAEDVANEFTAVQNAFENVDPYGTDSGTANNYVITTDTVQWGAYFEPQVITFKALNGNTTNSFININGIGAVALKRWNQQPLQSGDILAGSWISARFNSVLNAFLIDNLPSTISGAAYAAPTGKATLAASLGVLTTVAPSDSNIAIDQTIAPTWTGLHTFTPSATSAAMVLNASSNAGVPLVINCTSTANLGMKVTGAQNTSVQINVVNTGTGTATVANLDLQDSGSTGFLSYAAASATAAGTGVSGGVDGNVLTIATNGAFPIQIAPHHAVAVTIASGGVVTINPGNLTVTTNSTATPGLIRIENTTNGDGAGAYALLDIWNGTHYLTGGISSTGHVGGWAGTSGGPSGESGALMTTGNIPFWLGVNSTEVIRMASTGITIDTPASGSGPTLIVNGAAGNQQVNWTDGTHTGYLLTQSTSGKEVQLGALTNHSLSIATNGADRINISNVGAVNIAAPGSGVALTIATANAGASNSGNGILVSAGNVGGTVCEIKTTMAGIDSLDMGIEQATGPYFACGGQLQIRTGGFASGNNRVLVGANGNVTINTPASGRALQVNAVASSFGVAISAPNSAGVSNGLLIQAGTNSGDNSIIVQNAGASQLFAVLGDGSIFMNAIGSSASAANLVQSALKSILVSTSLRSVKTNIQPVGGEDAMSKVSALNPITFTSLCEADDPDQVHYGLIAEEVASVAPHLLHLDEKGAPRGVQYERLGVLLLAALQDMRSQLKAKGLLN